MQAEDILYICISFLYSGFMGCDFFFNGAAPRIEVQHKIIEFVHSYFSYIDLCICPTPTSTYRTRLGRSSDETETAYPFDFYGVIPFASLGITQHGQFVFDRSSGGNFVRILKLPDSFGIPPNESASNAEENEVVIMQGGYNRELGGDGFALVLNVIKLRLMPELETSDDYGLCDTIGNMIWKYGLTRRMADEKIDFSGCMSMLVREHEKRHPHPPSEPISQKPQLRIVDPDAIDIRVDDLELSVRTNHCLSREHIDTIGELLELSEKDLLSIRNFGRRNLSELREILASLGLHLRKE